jgi:transcriptional regulator with XRE-family HTH domain
MIVEKIFGQVLREIRKERGFSQEQLGFESGYHRTYISLLERGQKSPSLNTIFQLAIALKVTPSEILRRVEIRVGEIPQRDHEERSKNR